MLSRLPRPWRTLVVYGGLSLLVLAALALTALRLALPYVEGYRAQVERQLSASLGQPVRVERLGARLPRLSPTLALGNVQLLDATGVRTIAQFREIRVGLAPLASLRRGEPVLDKVTVVGASLAIERRADGSFHVQGLSLPDDKDSDPEAVGRWLLAQDSIALRDSNLIWRDAVTRKTFAFDGVALELSNTGERHRLNGHVHLPRDLGGALRVAVDMEGDPLAAGGLRGGFYVAAEKMRPAGLLRLFPLPGVTPGDGDLSFEVWGDWEQARLMGAQGQVKGNGLVFSSPRGKPEQIEQLAARFSWQQAQTGWRLDVADLVLARAGRAWEPTQVRVDFAGDASGDRAYRLHASFLRIEDLVAIAALVPAKGDWQRRLMAFAPRGDLSNVRVDFGPHGAVRAGAVFNDLSVLASADYPGASGLDGYAYYGDGSAGVRFATHHAHFDLAQLFRAPLVVDELTGELSARRDGAGWRISSDGLALANQDIRVRTALTLRVPDRGVPFLDLHGDFRDGDATTVPRYLPAHIMPTDAVAWLDRAFLGGRVVQGGLLVHGPVDQFPFDRGEGRFEVRFTASDVDLDYVPGWPLLSDIKGEVVFAGRSMRVDAERATLGGDRVSRTSVAIPDLLQSRLLVTGHVDGELNHLFDYLRVSELAGHLSPALARFQAGGPYTLDLQFEQPLEEELAPGTVRGTVVFDRSELAVTRGIAFTDIRGRVDFDDERYTSDAIGARLFGAPARLQVATLGSGDAMLTRVSLQGAADSQELQRALDFPLLTRLQGRTPWEAQLTLAHEEGRESALRLTSPLTGLALHFPEPLGKLADERRELSVGLWFTGPRAGEVEAQLGDRLATALAFGPEGELAKAAVHFGASVAQLPNEPGVAITGRLAVFDPGEWAGIAAPSGGGASASGMTERLPLRVDMEELGITSAADIGATTAAGTERRSSTLGPLDVRVGKLRYNRIELGNVRFHTTQEANRVLLHDLNMQAPAFTVVGRGEWRQGRKPRTELTLKATGKDLGAAANALGIASVISKGTFDVSSELAWNGEPRDLGLDRVEGTLKLKIKDGSVTEVKPGAGRLLGLLSLQALPQRLMLDFRDLFDKGMRFRTIEGTFSLKDGNAFSENLHMNALPAAVFVSGRTGLVQRDFDQTVTVVPDISGTLPVAGGLALGPQVGAALLLIQQLFHKTIDEAGKYKYTITGSWDKPVITHERKKR